MRVHPRRRVLMPRGTNVTFANLKITGCDIGPALTVGVEEDSLRGREKTARRDNAENNGRLEGKAPQPISFTWLTVFLLRVVRVESCVFAENWNFAGAAISATRSRLLVCKSLFRDNEAILGGAIHAHSACLDIRDSQFKHNSANDGGALGGDDLEVTLDGVDFEANTAAKLGGALYLEDSNLTLANTQFANNMGKDGGALFCQSCGMLRRLMSHIMCVLCRFEFTRTSAVYR